jgi:hypothetical protein
MMDNASQNYTAVGKPIFIAFYEAQYQSTC